jgi:hypothetical protein
MAEAPRLYAQEWPQKIMDEVARNLCLEAGHRN